MKSFTDVGTGDLEKLIFVQRAKTYLEEIIFLKLFEDRALDLDKVIGHHYKKKHFIVVIERDI